MSQRLLLKAGLVIDTEPAPVVHRETDVLIEDGRIVAVARDLGVTDAEVIDASDRIVLPGFVDTHRHLWEVALRGSAVDVDLMVYLQRILGEFGSRYRPEDVAAGNLVGALECLAAGITTVQDYSHVQQGTEHADAALDALEASGIRAVFGYGSSPLTGAAVDLAGMRHVVERAAGRITPALAAIGPAYAPLEVVRADWELAASLGLQIAVHIGSGPVSFEPMALLRDEGLLRPGILYVHGNSLPDSELKLIAESGGAMSITPAVESRMEIGDPMASRLRAAGVTTGLGIDVVTTAPGDMFSAMQSILALGYQSFSAADVLRMATLEGARALGLGDRIGSLRPGKQADIILLRASDINLIGGSQDPIGTVVTAAHPGNIDTVLVAGQAVKRDGRLLAPGLGAALEGVRRTVEYLAN